jgi:hypothetical protein
MRNLRRHDIQHNDTQPNYCQHNNKSIATLSIMTEYCYAKYHLYSVSLTLHVTYKPFMLSVIMLNVIILNVVMLSVVMMSVIMLNVIILNVVMLSVVMLNVVMLNVFMLNVVMLNVIMLSVVMLNVVILSVMALNLKHAHCQANFIFPSESKKKFLRF